MTRVPTSFARGLAALATGSLFGLGLAVSGMVDPGRVRGFLDVAGDWDASLAFVLAGAVGVALLGFRLLRRVRAPLLDARFDLPAKRRIDAPLLAGAALFGVGWGLAGLCPGPAVAALSFGGAPILLFVAALVAGVLLHDHVVAPALGDRSADLPGGRPAE